MMKTWSSLTRGASLPTAEAFVDSICHDQNAQNVKEYYKPEIETWLHNVYKEKTTIIDLCVSNYRVLL